MQNSLTSVQKENLLLKCKSSIEELQAEIEVLNRGKRKYEEELLNLERQIFEKESLANQALIENEKMKGPHYFEDII